MKQGLISKADFNFYKNCLSRAIKLAKELYFSEKALKSNRNAKQTWKFVNGLLKRNQKNVIKTIHNENNAEIEGKAMSNYFNIFFINIVRNSLNYLSLDVDASIFDFINNYVQHSCFLVPSSPNEIMSIIMSLKNKTCHLQDIPVKIMKSISLTIAPILSHVYNMCQEQGIYPDDLKMARVIPIYKAGCKKQTNNYRPISTLLTFNKIFEKLIYNRINQFVQSNNIISRFQFGFTEGSSPNLAIFTLTSDVLKCLHDYDVVICLFLDLKKAFDSVNHEILLSKLECYGLRGLSDNLLRSYLFNRRQYVEIDGENQKFCR